MKRWLVAMLRRWRLLALANRVNYYLHRLHALPANRRFRRACPDFSPPPPALAFEAYGHVSWDEYARTGRQHAATLLGLLGTPPSSGPLRVLEWGCGSGRILRHLQAALPPDTSLTGVDVDAAAIAWCQAHLPGVALHVSNAAPPLTFATGGFDLIYQYSVFTHLSAALIEAWVGELARLLAAGGLFVATTHGDHYLGLLDAAERARYTAGHAVSKANYAEGRKYFLSFHPPAYMRGVLERHFADVDHRPAAPALGLPQDIWLARNPRSCERAAGYSPAPRAYGSVHRSTATE